MWQWKIWQPKHGNMVTKTYGDQKCGDKNPTVTKTCGNQKLGNKNLVTKSCGDQNFGN